MTIVVILFNKLKSLLLVFVHLFKRALCCIRRKRRPSYLEDGVPLTHVGVIADRAGVDEGAPWAEWGPEGDLSHPKTVQDHIELYRKQKIIAQQSVNENEEEKLNFFEDMAPKIQRPPKVFIANHDGMESRQLPSNSRLNFVGDAVNLVPASELGEWEETGSGGGGWEGETLDWAAQEALREKKRQDRERRQWQQQQKRLEKAAKLSLGSKIST